MRWVIPFSFALAVFVAAQKEDMVPVAVACGFCMLICIVMAMEEVME